MNEITNIHLGRQAFTIAVDAHKALQDYLHAIRRSVGDKDDVLEEVELRMAELLAERGIHGDKVVLLKDVDYLKEQLGEPGDFGDEESEAEETSAPKRFFRDTEHGMLAGVAAGIAKYFNIDPLWVRLAFIALVFAGASGILIYIILWLIMPEAKTKSERLQMQGKPVTVDALKDFVEHDVKDAATRAGRTVGKAVPSVAKVVTKIFLAVVGVGLMVVGVVMLFALTGAGVYWALNHDIVPYRIFPVGVRETAIIILGFAAFATVALFFLLTGLSVAKRKWRLPGWGLGAMVAIFLASVAVGGALAADAAPKVRQRFQAQTHTYVRAVPEFHKLSAIGDFRTIMRYQEAPNYEVSVKYWGDADFSNLVTEVKDQTLTINSRKLADSMNCKKLCLFQSPIVEVVVRGPKLQEVSTDLQSTQLNLDGVSNQTIKVRAAGSTVVFGDFAADNFKAERAADKTWTLTFAGSYKDTQHPQTISLYEDTATISAKNIELALPGSCSNEPGRYAIDWAPVSIDSQFEKFTINGKAIGAPKDLQTLWNEKGDSVYKCVMLPGLAPSDNL